MGTIKELISQDVVFCEYRKGNLWYTCLAQRGFYFPVPIDDVGDGVFKHQDKGIYFMRYIRKHLKAIEDGQTVQ